jgi:RNA polymerase sigma-70 factor (ECF subfamily)
MKLRSPELSEAALVGRIAAGEREEPLIELYDRYATPIYRLGVRLLGDRGQAEDLVQETFLRLWRSAPRFDPGQSSVRSYVFMLARRAVVDAHRRAAVRPSVAGEPDPEHHAAPGPLPEEAFERLCVGLEVRDALDGLAHKHREVLELGYDEQLSQREIAARLGIPLGTVKTRTYHALRALRDELERRGIDA